MNGKGGTGKTTTAALFVRHLAETKPGRSILAIDADPNSCFAAALGVREAATIVGTCDEMSRHLSDIPGGMTKERYLRLKVQEAVVEGDRFDLLVMGRPEGPGCYCYVNNLLRDCMDSLTAQYDYVVIDNAAGMEHISRRMTRRMHTLVMVSDYSVAGIRSAARIHSLARELGIDMRGAFLIVNKVAGPLTALEGEIAATGLPLAGSIPYHEDLIAWSAAGRPAVTYDGLSVIAAAGGCLERMLSAASTGMDAAQQKERGS